MKRCWTASDFNTSLLAKPNCFCVRFSKQSSEKCLLNTRVLSVIGMLWFLQMNCTHFSRSSRSFGKLWNDTSCVILQPNTKHLLAIVLHKDKVHQAVVVLLRVNLRQTGQLPVHCWNQSCSHYANTGRDTQPAHSTGLVPLDLWHHKSKLSESAFLSFSLPPSSFKDDFLGNGVDSVFHTWNYLNHKRNTT